MPQLDGKGPEGKGPLTGRKQGLGKDKNAPDEVTGKGKGIDGKGRGMGKGRAMKECMSPEFRDGLNEYLNEISAKAIVKGVSKSIRSGKRAYAKHSINKQTAKHIRKGELPDHPEVYKRMEKQHMDKHDARVADKDRVKKLKTEKKKLKSSDKGFQGQTPAMA